MDECVHQAMSHGYGMHLLQHTDAYLAGVGIGVIAMEEMAKLSFLMNMVLLERSDSEIRKLQNLTNDHHAKLQSHEHLLANCLYMISAAAIIGRVDINVDQWIESYLANLDVLEKPQDITLEYSVFDRIKQRCFYIDVSTTPYLSSGRNYMSEKAACFYTSFFESLLKLGFNSWISFRPHAETYISLARRNNNGTASEEEYVVYQTILQHYALCLSMYPKLYDLFDSFLSTGVIRTFEKEKTHWVQMLREGEQKKPNSAKEFFASSRTDFMREYLSSTSQA